LAAIGPFAIDTYLPAFPSIAKSLDASPIQVQQTLTAFLLPFAFMTLWHGALSDALGRRRVILWSLLLFILASLACTFATRIEHLWIARALQGITGGAGIVVGRAIIRDVLEGPDAQRLMSHVAMMFGIAPAVAPIIGGWIYTLLGWRAVFGFLVLFTAVLLALSYRYLPETLPRQHRQSLRPVSLGKSYWRVFTRAEFLLLACAVSFNFNGFFLYVLSAPVFLIQHLGVSPHAFAWMFVPTVIGMMTGSYLSGRLAGRLSQRRTIAVGFCVMLAAATLNAFINWTFAPGVPHSVLPIMLYNVGMALAMPSITLLILDLFPQQRGLVSSCQGFVHGMTSTLTSAAIAPLLWATTLTLSFGMAGFLALGLAAFCLYLGRTLRRTKPTDPLPGR
jgi:DHA1 family bicyclomycin/chloramphenicol resistance-like MFS transporter